MFLPDLHFAHIAWLWGLLLIPVIWASYFAYRNSVSAENLENFIDKHLLKHLMVSSQKYSIWTSLKIWSVLWTLLMLALAGPRWDFQEIETYASSDSLVILFDLSQSMDVDDIKPSRIARGRQKVEDILKFESNLKIGLIAFAADPHMISPLTDDRETLRYLVPSLSTDLVYVQGSKLTPTLMMASKILEAEQSNNKAILVLSDGGFEDSSAFSIAKDLAQQGIKIYTMGLGTSEGGPVRDRDGHFIRKGGQSVISKLEEKKLRELSEIGHGVYLSGEYDEKGVQEMLDQIQVHATKTSQKTQIWEERFYIFIIPFMFLILFWFRRGAAFPAILLLGFMMTPPCQANIGDFFKNDAELGEQAFNIGDFDTALQKFKDPYRQGVTHYKAGNYAEAEAMFRKSSRPELGQSTTYNLGNALAKQHKFKEAIQAYEDVLQIEPTHQKAKHNLELLKKLMEEQEQEQEQTPKEEPQNQQAQQEKSQEDIDADQWLSRLESDPQDLLKGQFYVESVRQGTKEESDPW